MAVSLLLSLSACAQNSICATYKVDTDECVENWIAAGQYPQCVDGWLNRVAKSYE